MNGLVPEQRTNRNGVTQTKWVRPDARRATGAAPIPPAPQPQPSDEGRDRALSALVSFASEYGYDEDGFDDMIEQLEGIVRGVDGRTGRFLVEVLEEHNGYEDIDCIATKAASILRDPGVPEHALSAAVANLLHCVPERVEIEVLELGDASFAAVEVYEALPPEVRQRPFSDAYGEACRALGMAARMRPDDDGPWVADRRDLPLDDAAGVVEVLAQRPERAAEVAEEMAMRGRLDAATAREILRSGVLGDGAL